MCVSFLTCKTSRLSAGNLSQLLKSLEQYTACGCASVHGVTSPSSRCFTACSYSTYHYELALHPGKCAPVLDILCQREIPEGKFEQTHLQDVQISSETRNLAGLSEMLIVVWVGVFCCCCCCYISCLLLIQTGHCFLFHDISTLRICWECKLIPGFILSFFFLGEKSQTSAF